MKESNIMKIKDNKNIVNQKSPLTQDEVNKLKLDLKNYNFKEVFDVFYNNSKFSFWTKFCSACD